MVLKASFLDGEPNLPQLEDWTDQPSGELSYFRVRSERRESGVSLEGVCVLAMSRGDVL